MTKFNSLNKMTTKAFVQLKWTLLKRTGLLIPSDVSLENTLPYVVRLIHEKRLRKQHTLASRSMVRFLSTSAMTKPAEGGRHFLQKRNKGIS